jgi:hypothetical protein
MMIMKLTEYIKKGYGRTNNSCGKNQGSGVINNPTGKKNCGIARGTRRNIPEKEEWIWNVKTNSKD